MRAKTQIGIILIMLSLLTQSVNPAQAGENPTTQEEAIQGSVPHPSLQQPDVTLTPPQLPPEDPQADQTNRPPINTTVSDEVVTREKLLGDVPPGVDQDEWLANFDNPGGGDGSVSTGSLSSHWPQHFQQPFQVEAFTGNATIQLPLTVTQGRKGIQPALALQYSPRSGNGIFGMGWSLPVGYIGVSLKNGLPQYDGQDTMVLCLDGGESELVPLGNHEYRLKREGSFLRIVYHAPEDYWEVKDKQGRTYYFGLESLLQDDSIDSNYHDAYGDRHFRWYLSEVKDIHGNYMFIRHFPHGRFEILYTGEPGTDRDALDAGTQNFFAKVVAVLEEHIREDIIINQKNWWGGSLSRPYRMKELQIFAEDVLTRRYVFEYENSPRTQRALLRRIREYGADHTTLMPVIEMQYASEALGTYTSVHTDDPLAADHLWNYRYGAYDTGHENHGAEPPHSFYPFSATYTQAHKDFQDGNAYDINANGRLTYQSGQDRGNIFWTYLYVEQDKTLPVPYHAGEAAVGVYLNGNYSAHQAQQWPLKAGYNLVEMTSYHQHQGFAFDLNKELSASVDVMHSTQAMRPQLSADFNGDGLADLASYHAADNGSIKVALSNGPAFLPKQTWISHFYEANRQLVLGDFNCDGKSDIGQFDPSTGTWQVALSNGSGFDAPSVWLSGWGLPGDQAKAGDFNGDGFSDLFLLRVNGDGTQYRYRFNNQYSGFEAPPPIGALWGGPSDYVHTLGDVNADGLADFVLFNKATGDWQIRYFNPEAGHAWFDGVNDIRGFGAGQIFAALDYNGDGRTDLGYFDPAQGKIFYREVYNWNQVSEQVKEFPLTFNLSSLAAHVQSSDYNGDGVVDVAVYTDLGEREIAYSRNAVPADLMIAFSNGRGGITEWTYAPSTAYTNTYLPMALPVIDTVTVRDSRSQAYTTRYDYSEGYWDKDERSFRGFGRVRVADAEGHYTESRFLQGDVNYGLLTEQAQYNVDGDLFTKTLHTWSTEQLESQSTWTKLIRLDRFVFDGDSDGRATAEEYAYDQWGNRTQLRQLGEVELASPHADIPGDTREVRTSYVHNPDPDVYLIGLPKESCVLDHNGEEQRKTWYYYDGHDNLDTIPTRGLLTKQETANGQAAGHADNPTTVYTYTPYGDVSSQTDALGHATVTTYDEEHHVFPTEIRNALGQCVVRRYYGIDGEALSSGDYHGLWGQLKSSTDANSQTTKHSYDTFGRLERTVSPLDSFTYPSLRKEYQHLPTYTRTTTYSRIRHGEADTVVSVTFTDGLGRIIQTKTPSEVPGKFFIRDEVGYNSRGLPVKHYLPRAVYGSSLEILESLPPDLKYTALSYDAAGRLTRTNHPDGTYTDVRYDDWTTLRTDPNGHRQADQHDAYGRLIRKITFSGADGRSPHYPATDSYTPYTQTDYTYDTEGNLITIMNQAADGSPAAVVTHIGYDALGRKVWMDDPDMGYWQYAYDLNGNLIAQTDAKYQTIYFEYDALNRLTRKSAATGLNVSYTYDSYPDPQQDNGIGRLTRVAYQGGSAEFFYDALGREVRSVKTVDGQSYTMSREYNALNAVSKIVYPDGKEVFYNYDQLGRLILMANDRMLLNGGQSALPPGDTRLPSLFTHPPVPADILTPQRQGKRPELRKEKSKKYAIGAKQQRIEVPEQENKIRGVALSSGPNVLTSWRAKLSEVVGHIAACLVEPYLLGVKAAYADPIPAPWQHQDIGAVGLSGDAQQSAESFAVSGSGADIWNAQDELHFVYQHLQGDGELVARLDAIDCPNLGAKSGLMVRASLQPEAAVAMVIAAPSQQAAFQHRLSSGAQMTSSNAQSVAFPAWLKLVRDGDQFSGYLSEDGQSWALLGSAAIAMDEDVYLGLAVTSHDNTRLNQSTFSQVRINGLPAPWMSQDLGAVALNGSVHVDNGTFTLQASGVDIWDQADEGHFVYQPVEGEVEIVAQVVGMDMASGLDKAGVMIRDSLDSGAKNAFMLITPAASWAASFQTRSEANQSTQYLADTTITGLRWVKLTRSDDQMRAYYSSDGESWTAVGPAVALPMNQRVYAGLALTSHNPAALSTTVFTNVRVRTGASLPTEWSHADIGTVHIPGEATETNGSFTLTGSGEDIWGSADAFHMAYQVLNGSGHIIAKVGQLQGSGTAKAGVMFREDLTPGSKHVFMLLSELDAAALHARPLTGGAMNASEPVGNLAAPLWIRLVRREDAFSAYVSVHGMDWNKVGPTLNIAMADTVYAGLAVTNNNDTSLGTAVFSDVRMETAPHAPVLHSAEPADSRVALTWDAVNGADGYVVRVKEDARPDLTEAIDVGDTTTFTVTGLRNGTAYRFAVSAYNNASGLEGSGSTELWATPQLVDQSDPPTAYIQELTYTDSGQVASIVYGNGVITRYTYHTENFRLKGIVTTAANAAVIQDLQYTYDAAGNIIDIIDARDSQQITKQTFAYDHLNRLVSAVATDPDLYGTKTYAYDAFGNITHKDGKTYTYSRIAAGPHAVTATDDGQTLTDYAYDANGNMVRKVREGVVTRYTYDVENRLIRVQKNDDVIAEYVYDGDGGRVKKIDFTKMPASPTCFLAGTLVHMADGSRKAIEQIRPGDEVVSFDAQAQQKVAARVSAVFNTEQAAQYIVLNGELRATPNHLFYTQGEWRRIGKLAVQSRLLGLDLTDRKIESLQKIDSPQGVQVYNIEVDQHHNYFVGSEGYLVHNKMSFGSLFDDNSDGSVYAEGLSTVYIGALYEESNGHQSDYLFMGPSRFASVRDGFQHYFHADHLGGLQVRTDEHGLKQEEVWYAPFGTIAKRDLFDSDGQIAHHYFTGQYADDETGLYYFHARYYDPELGRFIQADTVVQSAAGNPQTLNRYAYCGNNPLNNIDPSGYSWFKKLWKNVVSGIAGMAAFIGSGFNPLVGFQAYSMAYSGLNLGESLATGTHIGQAVGTLAASFALSAGFAKLGFHDISDLGLRMGAFAVEGATIGAAGAAINDGDIAQGAYFGAGTGAMMGFLTSEHYQNYHHKEGFRSNQEVAQYYRDLAAAGDQAIVAKLMVTKHGGHVGAGIVLKNGKSFVVGKYPHPLQDDHGSLRDIKYLFGKRVRGFFTNTLEKQHIGSVLGSYDLNQVQLKQFVQYGQNGPGHFSAMENCTDWVVGGLRHIGVYVPRRAYATYGIADPAKLRLE
jgi:RHS repeat-associated protein